MSIKYKFNEEILIADLKKYIDSTYSKHYGRTKLQAFEVIEDAGHGVGFTIGNIMKYAKRYGRKAGYNRDDIMKILHYALLLLYCHDQELYLEKHDDNIPVLNDFVIDTRDQSDLHKAGKDY